jgi:hypothetical protein
MKMQGEEKKQKTWKRLRFEEKDRKNLTMLLVLR